MVATEPDNNETQKAESIVREKLDVLAIIRSNWIAIVIVAVLIMGYFALRTTPSDVASMEELASILNSGKPVLIEFYANT